MKYPKPNHNGQCHIKIYRCKKCEIEGAVKGVYPLVGLHNPMCPSCGAREVTMVSDYRWGAKE